MNATMERVCVTAMAMLGVTWVASSAAHGEQKPMPEGCMQIVAVLDEGGGGLSAEEIAKKTNTDIETVRNSTELWRSTMKDAPAPKGVRASDKALPE
jgi:hypothetical protein